MQAGDAARARLKSLLSAGDFSGIADFSISDLYAAIDPISERFTELIDVQLRAARNEYEAAQAAYRTALAATVALIVLAAALTQGIAVGTINSRVVRPLKDAQRHGVGRAGFDESRYLRCVPFFGAGVTNERIRST